MFVAVDFDGTCVYNAYPEMGDDIPGAAETLKRMQVVGHKIILYTMRAGKELDDAVEWFSEKGIRLYGINKNPSQPAYLSDKVFADLYIDDSAFGCPITDVNFKRGVDWAVIYDFLNGNRLI